MAEAQELRVQPHDLVAEQSVLGAIFINPEKLITVREFIEADDFYKYSHRVIFKAMVTLSDRNDAIDATTVRTILDDQAHTVQWTMCWKRWHCSENWKKDFRKITRNGLPQRL